MSDLSDRELLEALGVELDAEKPRHLSPREERVIAGFEEIQRFVVENGRLPAHGEGQDIFERIYAARLDRIRELPGYSELLAPRDREGLLLAAGSEGDGAGSLNDDELLAMLGVPPSGGEDITQLKHVRPRAEIAAAEEIAQRKRCEDFDLYKPLFDLIRADLESGARQTRRFREDAAIRQGEFFILGGQIAYVAAAPEDVERTDHGHAQGRLRIIYDNGTEGDNLLRSFIRALYKDETGRRITQPDAGPLFGDISSQDDLESGTIYVLRSRSENPVIAAHRELIHKIGVTGGLVHTRIANAERDPTYLLAPVDVVAEYRLYNINRTRLERLIHRVFEPARLDLALPDRFGGEVQPREWFFVPIAAIDEAVTRIKDGTIPDFEYDPGSASLVRR